MPRNRDRHQRGLRGPLSVANPITGEPVPLKRRQGNAEYFVGAVESAVQRIERAVPDAVRGITIGIEEVPTLVEAWRDEAVPLAAAVQRTDRKPAQVVVYRRPVELRATTRRELDDLVHRTIVEQLADLTGLDARTIDPGYDEDA